MVFLIRAMRSHPELRRFKIVLVTDRTDLQHQLSDTAGLAGETIKVARSAAEVRELLRQDGPAVVMAMIQKWRDTPANGDDADGLGEGDTFGTLNESESILVMVDEAHRSQASTLHANLMQALPNAARVGFTGTPIIMGERKRTLEIFGGYLDRYTLTESEADGSTVPILYEGRTTEAAVRGASRDGRPLLPVVRRPHRRAAGNPAAEVRHRQGCAHRAGADSRQGRGHPPALHRHGDARRLQGHDRRHQPGGVPAVPRGAQQGA